MNLSSRNLKLIIGVFYLLILFFGLYYLFSIIDIRDLTSYEFIKSNKEIIIDYKNNNFLFLTIIFFLFSIVWYLFLLKEIEFSNKFYQRTTTKSLQFV